MNRFAGKVVLVTGGSRGIGRACALEFAREGADVAVNYLSNRAEAEATVTEIKGLGGRARAYRADTSRLPEVRSLVEATLADFGRIDVLVNNAGVLRRTPLLDITEEEWDLVLNTDLKGYFLVGQAVAKTMVSRGEGGVIVNISSNREEMPVPNLAHYSIAKAGIGMLTKCMALELAPSGIRAVAVAPGLVETDLNRKDIADPAFLQRRLERIPLKLVGKPEDVAKTVTFLASDDARLATGHTVFIDAGSNIA